MGSITEKMWIHSLMIQLFKKQIAFNYIYLIKLKVSTALDMNTILKFTNSELRMLDQYNIETWKTCPDDWKMYKCLS